MCVWKKNVPKVDIKNAKLEIVSCLLLATAVAAVGPSSPLFVHIAVCRPVAASHNLGCKSAGDFVVDVIDDDTAVVVVVAADIHYEIGCVDCHIHAVGTHHLRKASGKAEMLEDIWCEY